MGEGEGGFLWRSCLLLAVLGGQGQGRDVPGQQSVTSTQSPSLSGHSAPEGQCPIPKAHPLPPPCPRHSWIQMLRVGHRIPPAPKQDPTFGQSLPPALHGLTSADTAQPQLELPEGRGGGAKGAARRHQLGVTVSCCCLTPKCKPIQFCPKNQTSTLLEPGNSPVLALRATSRDGHLERDDAGKSEHSRSFLEYLSLLHAWCISRALSTPAFPIGGKETRPMTTQKLIQLRGRAQRWMDLNVGAPGAPWASPNLVFIT